LYVIYNGDRVIPASFQHLPPETERDFIMSETERIRGGNHDRYAEKTATGESETNDRESPEKPDKTDWHRL